ncbi:MAG TPA: choice-of-anchor Q domain-containing protein [Rudaea sp.]|nr:choice-of-anchor Q domain-containing protein [Rudaea sp.]
MRSPLRHHACHLAICAALSIAADAAYATPLSVTNCYDDGRAGSLRSVIAGAASGDTIDLSGLPGADPACTSSRITLTQGQIPVSGALIVVGPGQEKLAIDGNDSAAIFYSADSAGTLTLRDVTVANGHNPGKRGGCINHAGSVVLDGAAVTDCTLDAHGSTGKYRPIFAGAGVFAGTVTLQNGANVSHNTMSKGDAYPGSVFGGGIATTYLYCTDSTISGNLAVLSVAGGAYVTNKADITRCTIDNNIASKYGGGLSVHGTTTIAESTISHNGGGSGGGISNTGTLTLNNSTVAFNYAGANYGAGIDSTMDVTLQSSIVADNTNQTGTPVDIRLGSGKRIFGGASLVRYTTALVNNGAIVSFADPMLAPLGNHGGLTRMHALLAGSPAIDAGSNPHTYATDQRGAGFAREVPTGKPDIGAYERQPNEDEIFGNGFD